MKDTVLLFARYFEPAFRGGGPIQTLVALLRARPETLDAAVICSNQDLGDPSPLVPNPDVWQKRASSLVWYCTSGLRPFAAAMRSSRAVLPRVIYLNSFFDVTFSVLPQLAARLGFWRGATVVLAPRGELYEGALRVKAGKKKLFVTLYRALGMHKRTIWHASTEDEAASIRDVFGSKVRIEVRENETSLPVAAVVRPPRKTGPLRVVFASRIAVKKGLLTLLQAAAQVTSDVEIEVIGAFEDPGYEDKCRRQAERLPLNVSIAFTGPLPREKLIQRLMVADVMALPTLGENFGHVIAEALSVACPVMCSEYTPWNARLLSGAGIVVAPNEPASWAREIDAFALDGAEAWESRSRDAARGYEEWRTESKGAHIFAKALTGPSGRTSRS